MKITLSFLLLFTFIILGVSCTQQEDNSLSTKEELNTQQNFSTNATIGTKSNLQDNRVKVETKNRNTQEAGFLSLSSGGREWTEKEVEAFNKLCNPTNKRANTSKLNLANYCTCLKDIMQEKSYKPDDLNKAVKLHQLEVTQCIKTAVR